jgi:polyhydroxyalkanoate synthesis repressor PhaR
MAEDKRRRRTGTGSSGTVVRKYPNRRLYNTATGEFVTLDDLRRMVVAGEAFVVEDAKSGTDITASILAQIIAEQEGRGESILPGDLMRQLIAFYDSGMSERFIEYLRMSMDAYTRNVQPFGPYGDLSKRNMDLMRKSFESFFGAAAGDRAQASSKDTEAPQDTAATPSGDEVSRLQEKLDEMQEQIDRLQGRHRRPRRGSKS